MRREKLGQFLSLAAGDLDNDGDIDVFLGGESVSLLTNLGAGVFLDIASSVGLGGSGVRFVDLEDLDNDGDLEILVDGRLLYLNDGTGTFAVGLGSGLFREEGGTTGRIGALVDLDSDGFVDVWEIDNAALYHNVGNDNHWIRIELVGTTSNRGRRRWA